MSAPWSRATCCCASWKACRTCRSGLREACNDTRGEICLSHQIRKLRMLAQIIDHKTAAGDDLQSVGADQLQRALHQFGGDATAAQAPRRLGMGDDDR